eukprot:gene5752-7941_t
MSNSLKSLASRVSNMLDWTVSTGMGTGETVPKNFNSSDISNTNVTEILSKLANHSQNRLQSLIDKYDLNSANQALSNHSNNFNFDNSTHSISSPNPTQKHAHARPWSYDHYLSRVSTFHRTAEWFAKPACISPIECARYGWTNSGVDQLKCLACNNVVTHNKDDISGEKLKLELNSAHDENCGWKNNCSPERFIGLQSIDDKFLQEEFYERLQSLFYSCITIESNEIINENNNNLNTTETSQLYLSFDNQKLKEFFENVNISSIPSISFPFSNEVIAEIKQVYFEIKSYMQSKKRKVNSENETLLNNKDNTFHSLLEKWMNPANHHIHSPIPLLIILATLGWSNNSIASSNVPLSISSFSSLSCHLCGRTILIDCFLRKNGNISRCLDPLNQHRYFCPWVNKQWQYSSNASNGVDDSLNSTSHSGAYSSGDAKEGWEFSVDAILKNVNKNNNTNVSQLSQTNDDIVAVVNNQESSIQAYKKIKQVLNLAAEDMSQYHTNKGNTATGTVAGRDTHS